MTVKIYSIILYVDRSQSQRIYSHFSSVQVHIETKQCSSMITEQHTVQIRNNAIHFIGKIA